MLKQNILYISESAALGGAELSLLDIIRALDKVKFTPFVVCSQDGPLIKKLNEMHIAASIIALEKVRQVRFWKFLISLKSLIRFIRENKIDVIHANSTRSNFLAGISGRVCSIPVIWHVRNLVAPGIYRDLEKYFTWLAQVIIVNSEATGRRFGKIGKKILVVYNGIDLDKFNSGVKYDKIRSEYNLSPQMRLVALVGRLGPGKGHDIFLQAVSQLKGKIKNIKYLIVGNACYEKDAQIEESLKSLVKSLGIEDEVIFTGFREDIAEIMSSINILVSPDSITGQAFGRVLAEAMASGKPVIASDAGGAREVVERDVTGILVPIRDITALAKAIRLLIEDPDLSRRMGEAGRKRAQQLFDLNKTIKQIENVYEHFIVKPGGR